MLLAPAGIRKPVIPDNAIKHHSKPSRSQPNGSFFVNHDADSANSSSIQATETFPSSPLCCVCKDRHKLLKCDEFLSKSPHDRYSLINANNLCLNCFGAHLFSRCHSKFSCKVCNASHHTLLHFPERSEAQAEELACTVAIVVAPQPQVVLV